MGRVRHGRRRAPARARLPRRTRRGGDYGFVGTRTWGYRRAASRVDLSRRLDSGHATGSIELYTATVDECAGDYGDDAVSEVVTLDVSVTATGPLATFRGHGSYKVPSEFNAHQNYRGKERAASGTVVGRLLDRCHVRFRGYERVDLVGPQQQLSPLTVRSPKPRARCPGLRHARFEPEARHVVGKDRPGESLDRAQLPQAALGPVVRACLVALGGLVLGVPGEDLRRRSGGPGATSSVAVPSTMTTSSPISMWIAIRGFSRRLRCQRVGPPSTYQRSPTQAPQIGMRCGAPSAPVVASQ